MHCTIVSRLLLRSCAGQQGYVAPCEETVEVAVAMYVFVHQQRILGWAGKYLLQSFRGGSDQVYQETHAAVLQGGNSFLDFFGPESHVMHPRSVIMYKLLGGARFLIV